MRWKLTQPADAERQRRGYLLGGRIRISTVALIVAFLLVWWVYDAYQQPPKPAPAPQVVPPGFVPDPAYTWVPRTRVEQPPVTITKTLTPPTVTETVTPTTTSEPPPPPFCPPFCPPPPPPPPESPAPESPPPSPGTSTTPPRSH